MDPEDISICDMDVMDEEAIDARLARSEAARCSLRHGTGSGGLARWLWLAGSGSLPADRAAHHR
jgi:hypothetical protein